jgi:hypothetical protein
MSKEEKKPRTIYIHSIETIWSEQFTFIPLKQSGAKTEKSMLKLITMILLYFMERTYLMIFLT